MKLITLLFASLMGFSALASDKYKANDRETFYQDANYVYQVSPYKHTMADEKAAAALLKKSSHVFKKFLSRMVEMNVIPKEIISIEDLNKMTQSEEQIDVLASYLNGWVEKQKKRNPYNVDWVDALPDAVMLFGGVNGAIGKGISGAGSINAGIIIMPVKVTRIDKLTQKMDTYTSAKVAIVGMPNLNGGVGISTGSNLRAGIGMLWSTNNQIVDPTQFVGTGMGVSATIVPRGFGINLKMSGMAYDKEAPMIDFLFASASFEFGVTTAVDAHISVTGFIPGETLMSYLNPSAAPGNHVVMEEEIRQMERELMLTPANP